MRIYMGFFFLHYMMMLQKAHGKWNEEKISLFSYRMTLECIHSFCMINIFHELVDDPTCVWISKFFVSK